MAGTAHAEVAAYVLGALNEHDTLEFEAHLLDCSGCQLELLELHDLPELLDVVKRSWPAAPAPVPGPRVLSALLDEAAADAQARRRRRRAGMLVAAAAAVLIIAGPLVTMAAMSGGTGTQAAPAVSTGPAPAVADPEYLYGRIGYASTVSAKVDMRQKDWGTEVDLELSGVTGPLSCHLFAVSQTGDTQVVTGWAVPVKGYGVAGSPEPLRVSGGTALTAAEIERFEVRADDGSLMVTVKL